MNLSKRNFIIILTAVAIIVFGLGVVYGQYIAKNSDNDIFKESLESGTENSGIVIDLRGAVQNPGVYNLPVGTRIGELIEQAGLLEDADTSAINLARMLKDGEIISVPYQGENIAVAGMDSDSADDDSGISSNSGTSDDTTNTMGKININTASLEELDTLPGIGPAKASSIINYRLENGYFTSIDEIMNVSGIGETTYEKLKDLITVD